MKQLLSVKQLSVKFPTRFGEFTALDSVDLSVNAGEIHGLVGESGAGKSTVGAAIMGLLQSPGYVSGGEIVFMGEALTALTDDEYHRLRGQRISMIFQDPQTSLNPLLTISSQLIETIRQHDDVSHNEARRRAVALLEETGLQDVETRMDEYPHQFSGGMRQRVVIALALCTNPDLIIADEPTTALDVAVQKQILELIRSLCTERNIGIILITHDIGVINEITDQVTVLRSGRVIETGTTPAVLGSPKDDYTQALMSAVPRLDKRLDRFKNIVKEDALSAEDNRWRVEGASAEFASEWLLAERDTALTPVQHFDHAQSSESDDAYSADVNVASRDNFESKPNVGADSSRNANHDTSHDSDRDSDRDSGRDSSFGSDRDSSHGSNFDTKHATSYNTSADSSIDTSSDIRPRSGSNTKTNNNSLDIDRDHVDSSRSVVRDENILSVSNLSVVFNSGQPSWFGKKTGFKALSDISFNMRRGEVLGVVGESGSGKSTLAKAIVGLVDPAQGSMYFRGNPLPAGSARSRSHPIRRQIQMVFQDPYSSLNNRRTVEDIIAEPIRFYKLANDKATVRKLVASVLELVEMPQRAMLKYPHQFSGGQRQRVAVARALVARPEFLICDEPTSALDVSIQAQMLNLLKDLQQAFGLSILFISHNLAVIRQMADTVLVLRNGQLIETAETESFFASPSDPYSQMLLRETPSLSLLNT